MSWTYVDDNFPLHPKVIQAGEKAAYLFVCGLCYCRRFHTGGMIPAAAVRALGVSGHTGPLAERLLEVKLWTRVVGGFQVHDYDHIYATEDADKARRQQKRASGLKGAETRWQNNRSANGTTMAPATDKKIALGVGTGPGVSVSLEWGAGENFDFQAALRHLTNVYPAKGRSSGYLTETAFNNQLTKPDGISVEISATPEEIFTKILVNLETQKTGAQWKKEFIPKLERWLREGLWTQIHEPAAEPRLPGGVKNYHEPWECPHVEPCNNRLTCNLRTAQGRPEVQHAHEAASS